MSLKNSIKNWFKLVHTATDKRTEKQKIFAKYLDSKNEVIILESIDFRPNQYLENNLGTKWCVIKYCPENWLKDLQEGALNETVHRCTWFFNCKCSKPDCPIKQKNHEYFDAKKAYEDARQEHINSVKRVFGLRVK